MQKLFSGGVKEWILLILGAALLLAALLVPLKFALANTLTAEEQQLWDAYCRDEVIRIHVIANSDSYEDQALKYKVRDSLIEAFGAMMQASSEQSSDAAFRMLAQNQNAMLRTATECATTNGFYGDIRAEIGHLLLPAKQYGNILLPEGQYRALRIVIGEGKGENWWCILYPQLCLALAENADEQSTEIRWTSRRIFDHWLLYF